MLSWNSLTQNFGPTLDTRFLFTVIREADMIHSTMDDLLRAWSWSLNCCLEGKTPYKDWRGRPINGGGADLCGGWKGAACQCRGDWEFYRKFFKFPRWNEAKNMCPFCEASASGDLRLGNVRPDAPWRSTIFNHHTRLAYCLAAGMMLPVFFTALIGFRLECVHVDTLHTVELGMGSHVAANILWHVGIVKGAFGGTTHAAKIKRRDAYLRQWYKDSKCSRKI